MNDVILEPPRSGVANAIPTIVASAIGLWLAVGFLLQGTFLDDYSARSCLPVFSSFWQGHDSILCAALMAATFGSYWSFIKSCRWKAAIWACLLLNMGACVVALFRADALLYISASSRFLLVSVVSGLLAARLFGSTDRAIRCIGALIGVEAAYTIVRLICGFDDFYSGHVLRASGTYGAPQCLYRVLVVALPLTIAIAAGDRPFDWRRVAWWTCAAVIALSLLLTWYRAAAIACLGSLTFLLMRLPGRRLVFAVAGLLLLVALGTFGMRTRDKAGQLSSRRSVASRFELWRQGWRVFELHPVLGGGQGSLAFMGCEMRHGECTGVALPGPQNQMLFALAEGGVVGAVALLTFVATSVYSLSRLKTVPEAGLAAAWIGLSICGMTDMVFGVGTIAFGPINCTIGLLAGSTLMVKLKAL